MFKSKPLDIFKKHTVFILYAIVIFSVVGIIYEEGSTPSRAFGFKGLYMEAITDWPVTQIFISNVFAFLYALVQDIPWYGLIEYSVVISSLLIFYRIIQNKSLLFLIPFLVLIVDDLVLFSFTRTAMLASAAGLFALFIELKKIIKPKNVRFYVKIGLYSLLCLYGSFNRPQVFAYISAIFFLFLITYFLIHRDQWKSIKSKLVFLSVPYGLVLIFLIINQLNLSPSIREAQRLTPAFYNIHSSNYHEAFETVSRKDSLALVLIKASYVNDLEVMNEEFVKRITQNQPQTYLSIDKFTNFHKFKQNIANYIPFYIEYHLFDIIISLLLIFYVLSNKNLNTRKRLLISLYFVLVIASLIAITNIVKMEMRISSPLFVVLFISLLLLTDLFPNKDANKRIGYLSILVSLYFFVGIFSRLNAFSNKQEWKVEKNLAFKKVLDSKYNHYDVVLSNSSLNIIHRYPFQEFKDHKTFTIRFFEGEAMAYQPIPRKNFIDYCGSIKVEEIFDKMFQQKDKTVYLATPESKELMTLYLEANYDKDYIFKVVDTLSYENERFQDIYIYQPVKITLTDTIFDK